MKRITSLIACLTAGLLAFSARAATLTVTSTADSGAGSLREAIAMANAGDTVVFASTLSGQTITLTSGELLMAKNLTISGPGASLLTISGGGASRLFNVSGAVTVTLSGMTLTGGYVNGDGGAILNSGGHLTVNECLVSSNTCSQNGGAIIIAGGSATVNNSALAGNDSGLYGGAIYVDGGRVTLNQSTLAGNHAVAGGGICVYDPGQNQFPPPPGVEGIAEVFQSTIAGNTAANFAGGGILNYGGVVRIGSSLLVQHGGGMNYWFAGYNSAHEICGNVIIDDNSPLSGPGVTQVTDAGLDPSGLQDNGGLTPTIALLSSSPAIDAVTFTCAPPAAFDQRGDGFPRLFGTGIDIGAFEWQGQPTPNLALSDQHITVHYHDKDAPGATDDNRGYTHADIRGDVAFVDPSRIPQDILASDTANSVTVHVKAVLGGQVVADASLTLGIHDPKREKWESVRGQAGPVEALKIHWKGALKFTSKDSNPASPKIESKFIGLDTTDLRYEAKPGTYTTTLPSGVEVAVTDGKITGISGASSFEIAKDGKRADLTLPYRLVPGMVLTTAGDITDTITVTPDLNYTTVTAKFQLKLRAEGLASVPLFNATPDTLQYEFTLGTGAGEWPAFATSTIGAASTPWERNADNHKKYKDDETTD
jgi:hypothetical protein